MATIRLPFSLKPPAWCFSSNPELESGSLTGSFSENLPNFHYDRTSILRIEITGERLESTQVTSRRTIMILKTTTKNIW